MSSRSLRTSTLSSRDELADALQAMFVAELLAPSEPLWIVTPWISDISVLDNSAGLFSGLLPDLSHRKIRLSEVLLNQLLRGGSVVIACRPDEHNSSFVEQFGARVVSEGKIANRFKCEYASELHEKGILSSSLLLSGSMNLTYNGVRRLEESILITDATDSVTRARHAYEDRWGSV